VTTSYSEYNYATNTSSILYGLNKWFYLKKFYLLVFISFKNKLKRYYIAVNVNYATGKNGIYSNLKISMLN